ncbi:unnamed protein product [Closterium sp. Yama58-4]|nr:unnamed protein product [Closterium sp. Yama58-4]
MSQLNVSFWVIVLLSVLAVSTFPAADAQSYLAIRAQAARKAANDADALAQAAQADYNDKLKAENAAKKAVDDADADLAAAQTDLDNKKKKLDDTKAKGEKARQDTIALKQTVRDEQDYDDELEMNAGEADNNEKQSAQDIIDAQARANLTADLLTEQNAIVKEATDDSTYYARLATKLKTPQAQADALEAQSIRAQAIRIQGALVTQAKKSVERVGRMQFEWAATAKDKTDTRKQADDHKVVLNKAKKDANDAEALYNATLVEAKNIDAAIKQQSLVVAAKIKAAKDARVPLAKASAARAASETKFTALKSRADGFKAAADKAEKENADYEAANKNGNGNGNLSHFSYTAAMSQFNISFWAIVLLSALTASTFSAANAQSYLATRAQAARKAANDADALALAAQADYNEKLKAENAAKKAVDDADADLAAAQTDLNNKKKQLDDTKAKGEKARQDTIAFKQTVRDEQEYNDELEMDAGEAENDEKEFAKDIVDAQARANLTADLLTEQNAIVKEATDDSTYYARLATKLKTPQAQADALEAQSIRAQAVRIQGALVKQAQRAVERVGKMQFEWAATNKDKADTRKKADDHKLVLNKAKKDAADAETAYNAAVVEAKNIDAAIKQQAVVVVAKTKVAKDARIPLAKASTIRAQSETKYNALKSRADSFKAAADKAEKEHADNEAKNNGNGNNN